MTEIGRKIKAKKATQPQYVVQVAEDINQYAKFATDEAGELHIVWVGDPNAATKFDSKYGAKLRVRELDNVPQTRCFRELV